MYQQYFEQLFKKIKYIEGDIVECGVGLGETLSIIASLCKKEGKNRKLWGFDSFEGFPVRSSHDYPSHHKSLDYYDKVYINRVSSIRDLLEYPTTLIKGYFRDTIPNKYIGNKIALLHLDCDLYESYKDALQLYQYLSPGGAIAFDEYMGQNDLREWPGAKKAIDEFLKETNLEPNFVRNRTFYKMYVVNHV